MKKLFDLLGNVLYIVMILWDIIEFLALPALFLIIGLINSFPWQYYAISIGGYFALFIISEIVLHFIFKALEKNMFHSFADTHFMLLFLHYKF